MPDFYGLTGSFAPVAFGLPTTPTNFSGVATGVAFSLFGNPSMPTNFVGVASSFVEGAAGLTYTQTAIAGTATTPSFVLRAPNGTWLVRTRNASSQFTLHKSTDGLNWTSVLRHGNADAAIRPSDGLLVVANSGAFSVSMDYATWTTQSVTGYTSTNMVSVCWTGTEFRAIGSNWDCFGSDGNGTWTRIGATGIGGASFSLGSVRHGNGVLVLGANNGIIRRSTNGGSSWGVVTSQFGTDTILRLHYDAATGTWVAVGTNGKISVSTDDGATWTARTSGVSVTLWDVAKVGAKWLAVGSSGVVLESDDTVAWTLSTGVFGASNLTAIGADGDEAIIYSTAPELAKVTYEAGGGVQFLEVGFGSPASVQSYPTTSIIRQASFGTPQRHIPNIAYVPFGPVEFGRPVLGFVDLIGAAEGFTASFGLPRILESLPDTTQPATPDVSYHDYRRVTGVRLPVFGTPYSASNVQTVAYRFLPVKFGRPSLAHLPRARGLFSTRFGKPSTMTDSVHSTYRIRGVGFGYPRLRIEPTARGFSSTGFGTPIDPVSRASGFSSVRFGLPETEPNPHRAFGFSLHGRFGQPRSIRGIEHADGFFAPVFGEPRIEASHVALHIWPQTQFGAPLMKRVV